LLLGGFAPQLFSKKKIYPTTQTLHSNPSISAMLTSLLPSEGFYAFSKIKFQQQVLDKNLSPSSLKSLI
jgi:hypothetical protein